ADQDADDEYACHKPCNAGCCPIFLYRNVTDGHEGGIHGKHDYKMKYEYDCKFTCPYLSFVSALGQNTLSFQYQLYKPVRRRHWLLCENISRSLFPRTFSLRLIMR